MFEYGRFYPFLYQSAAFLAVTNSYFLNVLISRRDREFKCKIHAEQNLQFKKFA